MLGGLVVVALAFDWRRISATFPVDPDLLDTVLLAHGLQGSGFDFLRSWGYTPDNWMLSLLAPEYPIFSLMVPSATVVVGAGLAILLLVAVLATVVIRLAFPRSRAGWLALPFLLVPNQDAIGKVGFLGYGVTHNVSLAWGLAAVACAMRAVSTSGAAMWGWSIAGGLAVAIDALSDPWADAAFLLPMTIASFVMLFAGGAGRLRARAPVFACQVAAMVAVLTRGFGALDFLPPARFGSATIGSILSHADAMIRSLALLLWPVAFVTCPVWTMSSGLFVSALVLLPIAAALGWSIASLWRARHGLRAEMRFLCLAASLSIAGTASAFIIGTLPVESTNGRFFINIWAFVPLLVLMACLVVGADPRRQRLPLNIIGALAVAIFLASMRGGSIAAASTVDRGLGRFLLAHDLHDGYGAYWGTGANVVTWQSDWQVHLRPVVFDRISGEISRRGGETSPLWYSPADRVPGDRRSFVVLARDAENCEVMTICEQGLTRQFGSPDRILATDDMRIWIWERVLPPISAEPR